jgi:hypothetical protein
MLSFFALLTLSLTTVNAEAGKVLFISGNVSIHRGESIISSKLGMNIEIADQIKTDDRGSIVIVLRTGAQFKLKPNSSITITDAGRNTIVDVQSGGLFTKVEKRSANQKFIVRAQTMVAAVRGTEFFFAYGKSKGDKSDLWLCVNEGLVNVLDTSTVSNVDVKQGEGIIIPTDKAIPKPKSYAWTKKLNWNMNASTGSVLDESDLNKAYGDLRKQNYD